MKSRIVLYRRRGNAKPMIGVKPIYGESGRKLIDYELHGYNGVDILLIKTLANMGINNTLQSTKEVGYSLSDKARMATFYVQCKNNSSTNRINCWVTLDTLKKKSTISSDVLSKISMFVQNPSSYK